MRAIYTREMRAYFTTPIGYLFLAVYFLISGAVFSYSTLYSLSADVTTYFTVMLFLDAILLPLLTMKSFSEERKQKTDQLLLTAPISLTSMVMAKFLAAYTMFFGATCISSLSFLILYRYAIVDTAVLLGNIAAILLVGMAFIAVGIFVSSITENQLASAVGTVGILLFFLAISFVNAVIPFYWLRFVLSGISIFARYQNFLQGIFDVASLVYYLSVSAAFLFLTVRVFAKRRWN